MSEKAFFAARDLSVGYNGKAVVREINFSVSRGEVLALIGPNGSGKSTLLRTIAGLQPALGGDVLLDGQPMQTLSRRALAQKMAVVLTGRTRAGRMTCFDMVAAGRYPYTGRLGFLEARDRAVVLEVMDQMGLSHLKETEFDRTSDGQKQLLLLARAICQEPELLLLDEPTSFLDIRYKVHFLELLRMLVRERSLAVLVSLHEIDLAAKVSDRAVCIRDGRIDRQGAGAQILTPAYVSELFGLEEKAYLKYYDVRVKSPEGEASLLAGDERGVDPPDTEHGGICFSKF